MFLGLCCLKYLKTKYFAARSCFNGHLCLWCVFQVVPLLMKAIGWQGGSILALETLKRVVVAGNRARDALVAQGLK